MSNETISKSLKLPKEVSKDVESLAKECDKTPHGYMVMAIKKYIKNAKKLPKNQRIIATLENS